MSHYTVQSGVGLNAFCASHWGIFGIYARLGYVTAKLLYHAWLGRVVTGIRKTPRKCQALREGPSELGAGLVAHQCCDILNTAIGDDDNISGVEFGVQDCSIHVAGAI